MEVNVEEIRNVVSKFRDVHKCKRVFLSGEAGFDQKYFSFRLSAISKLGGEEVGDVIPLVDDVIWADGDEPSHVEIRKADVIAVFDNTATSFFGNIAKSECEFGSLITTKGIVTLNGHSEGLPDTSGFVSWKSFLVGNQSGIEYCEGANVYLYTDSDESDGFPHGKGKAFLFWQSKLSEGDIHALIRKLKSVVGGGK